MPCAAARREVAKVCAGEHEQAGEEKESSSGKGEKGGEEASGRSGEEVRPEDFDPPSSSCNTVGDGRSGDAHPGRPAKEKQERETGPGVGDGGGEGGGGSEGGGGGGGGRTGCWWNTVRARLVRGGGFTECAAQDVLARLEWAAEQEDDEGGGGAPQDGGTAASAMAMSDDGNRDGSRGDDESGCGRRRRRMLRHLDATKGLCEEWGLLAGAGAGAGAFRRAGNGAGAGAGGGSWSGWEAFGLAVATSASRDRLSLCCWAVRPLMGGDGDAAHGVGGDGDSGGGKGRKRGAPRCPGLPRGEVVELLCLMLCALRSLEVGGHGGGGFVRLKADLLVCARVLENWDVR